MNARVIAVANQKGGVGKTTTVVNLAASLVERGRRVLIVDLDPQGNATMGSGIVKNDLKQGVYQLLIGEMEADKVLSHSDSGGYDVLPASPHLAGAEVELVQEIAREARLKNGLQPLLTRYDYILIDCPPSLTLLTLNGLVAAEGILIPMLCEYYSLEGLSDLIATLRKVRTLINPNIYIVGILCTMLDTRSNLAQQVAAQLVQHFGNKLFKTAIPRNVRLAEAPSHGMPALAYDRTARGTLAYLALADEFITRMETGNNRPVADNHP